MQTIQIEILNPKAIRLLKNLADQKLIAIKKNSSNDKFLKIVWRIRNKERINTPSLTEITKEVEFVRAKRYAKAKK
jgi:hypothetical protein